MKKLIIYILFFIQLSNLFAQSTTLSPNYNEIKELVKSGDVNRLSQILSDRKVNIDGDKDEIPYLFYACSTGNVEMVQFLIDKGANPNIISPYGTAAHWAGEKNHINIIGLLIKRGFNPKIEEMNYWIEQYNTDRLKVPEWMRKVISKVIEHKLPVNNYPYMAYTDPADPLLLAASISDQKLKITKQLLKKGCNVNLIDKKGMTALHVSIQKMKPAAVKLFIKNNSDVNMPIYSERFFRLTRQRMFDDNLTPLHFLLHYLSRDFDILTKNKKQVLNILSLLVSAGADVNAITKEKKQTVIDVAQEIGDKEIIKILSN